MLGGYPKDPGSLPDDAIVGMGTSPTPILILTILSAAMILFLIILSRRKLPGYMPIVGSNSLALAASCRVSLQAKVPKIRDSENRDRDGEVERSPESLKDMTLHPLKWGELGMLEDWRLCWQKSESDARSVKLACLGFGTELDKPRTPVEGRWYK